MSNLTDEDRDKIIKTLAHIEMDRICHQSDKDLLEEYFQSMGEAYEPKRKE